MQARDLYPIIGREDHGIAATLEQLLFYCRKAGGEARVGLAHMTRFVNRSRSAISRYLRWLESQGFITIRRVRDGVYTHLYIRVLIRLRKRDGTSDGTSVAPYTQGNTQEKTQGNSGEPCPERAGSGTASLSKIRGSLSGAEERVREKRKEDHARTRENKPSPKAAAHIWVRLLGEYGYLGFSPDDLKHLKHIQKSIDLFDKPTLGAFEVELERRIGMWQNARPKALGKAPPHPWAINRTDVLFQQAPEDDELKFTELTKTPLYNPPKVDESKKGYKAPEPVIEKAKGLSRFLKKN